MFIFSLSFCIVKKIFLKDQLSTVIDSRGQTDRQTDIVNMSKIKTTKNNDAPQDFTYQNHKTSFFLFGVKNAVKYFVLTRDCFVKLNIQFTGDLDDVIVVMISYTRIGNYSRKQEET
jgi:hypothetical protein